MTDRPTNSDQPGGKATKGREDRLRAALRANLARRKAQARARQAQDDTEEDTRKADTGGEDS